MQTDIWWVCQNCFCVHFLYVTDDDGSWLAGLSILHCLVKPKGLLAGLEEVYIRLPTKAFRVHYVN